MKIGLPSFGDESSPRTFMCRTFRSTFLKVIDFNGDIIAAIPESAGFQIAVENNQRNAGVAVRIPSTPLDVLGLRNKSFDLKLRGWWEQWRHNVAVSVEQMLSTSRDVGPVFLVLEKTVTDQASNCYYEG